MALTAGCGAQGGGETRPPFQEEERLWILPGTDVMLPYDRELELYTPDPPFDELAQSPMLKRGDGMHIILEYCVDTRGAVDAVELKRSSGEDYLDAVMIRTIRRWRFQAIMHEGVAVRACSNIEFKMVRKPTS